MSTKDLGDLGVAAGDIIDRAFTLGYETARTLLTDNEQRLTAEQVENVRAAREELRGYRNFTGYGRSHVNRLIAAVDALFPATEPAEPAASEGVNCGANSVVLGWCTLSAQHEGLHTNGTYFWGQAPAPAEPAEEETKAEHNASVARREALGRVAQQLYEQSFDGCDGTFYHDFGRALEDFLPSQGWTRIPTSSPVVPAPTETEAGLA